QDAAAAGGARKTAAGLRAAQPGRAAALALLSYLLELEIGYGRGRVHKGFSRVLGSLAPAPAVVNRNGFSLLSFYYSTGRSLFLGGGGVDSQELGRALVIERLFLRGEVDPRHLMAGEKPI